MQPDAPHFGATPDEAAQPFEPQFGSGNDQGSPTFGHGDMQKEGDVTPSDRATQASFPPNLQDFDDELDKCTNVDRLTEAQQHIADFLSGFDEAMKQRIAKAFPRSVEEKYRKYLGYLFSEMRETILY